MTMKAISELIKKQVACAISESVQTPATALNAAPQAKGRKKKRPGCPTSASKNMIAMLTHKNGFIFIGKSF